MIDYSITNAVNPYGSVVAFNFNAGALMLLIKLNEALLKIINKFLLYHFVTYLTTLLNNVSYVKR